MEVSSTGPKILTLGETPGIVAAITGWVQRKAR
jgi:hypothetical protein